MSNKVYVSSTCSDLKEFREAVNNVLRELCYDVRSVEEELETDHRPIDKSLDKVKECDSYIGIFGWRYGHIPEGYDKAITELEYRQAGEASKLRFIFMADEEAPWDENHKDTGPNAELMQRLRTELAKDERVEFFDSPRDLAVKVAGTLASEANKQLEAALNTLRMEQESEDEKRRARLDSQRVINVPPLEVGFFGGRRQEIEDFNRYIVENDNRLISIVGRGGIGKTALACYLMGGLEKDAKLPVSDGGREQSIDGIVYLSAVSTGVSLERIFADMRRLLGEPHDSTLHAKWLANIPLEAKINHLLEAMKDGLYLILMDNMETVQDQTGNMAEEGLRLFVEQCSIRRDNVKLIATSREKIIVSANASPHHQSILLEKGLDQDTVVEVLRELDPQGEIGLKDAPESDLREVGELTGGIPRALEILAGILYADPDLTLSKMLANKNVFGDEVMNYLVAAGYEHLEEEAKKVVESLAVYQVPMVETAVKFLLSEWFPGLDVTGILTLLVNNFVVHMNKVTGEYHLHPLDMEYAYDKIPKSDSTC
ncbi:MAG: DUF4062 domain-containing protein [Desulfobacterales bacterium]|nr:DUF4062 domain-containing protein [Desulfobacterales bacterium]